MVDLFNYTRRASSVAHIGAIDLGGDNPIRIQSMTTTNTNDTEACVRQAEEIIKAGGELVRFTTQGSREAENMKNINAGIRADGYQTPLVADVHFNPNVADVAALYCEKVRVNPTLMAFPAICRRCSSCSKSLTSCSHFGQVPLHSPLKWHSSGE